MERYFIIGAICNQEECTTGLLISETDNKITKYIFSEEFQNMIIAGRSLRVWYNWKADYQKFRYLIKAIRLEGLLCVKESRELYRIVNFIYNYVYDSLLFNSFEDELAEIFQKYGVSRQQWRYYLYRMSLIFDFFIENFE